MIDYRGFTVEPKRDFGPIGFLVDGQFTKIGYVVTKRSCNAMPGAVWFRTIEDAKTAIDALADTGSEGIWSRTDGSHLACAVKGKVS